jgi:hypothetical protein
MAGTHHVHVRRDVVLKTFKSWDRQEHVREWDALVLLSEYAPGLAPMPLAEELNADPPTVHMSRLTGEPLGKARLGSGQLAAVADAISRLHGAVPTDVLSGLRPRVLYSAAAISHVEALCRDRPPPDGDPLVQRAWDAGLTWLAKEEQATLGVEGVVPVFGHGDPNPANYLWDGRRVYLVDFEDSGASDRAFELAVLAEHLSVWRDGFVAVPALLQRFDLGPAEQLRLAYFRRLWALFWLVLLLPGGPADQRNPKGTLQRQSRRLLALLD